MQIAEFGDVKLHYRVDGDPNGRPVVFANSLGTDLRLWDQVLPLLPEGLCYLRYDKRGHGLSSCPPAPYSMGSLVSDVERLMDHLNLRDALFVGLSIGGMIAQGLAAKRLDLVRGHRLDTGAEAAFYPGALPEDPAQLLTPAREGAPDWLDADYAVMRFAPQPMSCRPGEGPPHIRLDRAAEFLFGDCL